MLIILSCILVTYNNVNSFFSLLKLDHKFVIMRLATLFLVMCFSCAFSAKMDPTQGSILFRGSQSEIKYQGYMSNEGDVICSRVNASKYWKCNHSSLDNTTILLPSHIKRQQEVNLRPLTSLHVVFNATDKNYLLSYGGFSTPQIVLSTIVTACITFCLLRLFSEDSNASYLSAAFLSIVCVAIPAYLKLLPTQEEIDNAGWLTIAIIE
jgi:hypothetical protein